MPHGYVFVLLCYIGRNDSYNSQGDVYTIGVRLRVARFDGQAMREPLECGASNK